ncbi:MAG: PAS domain-containing sensor histidine kinase [Fischerella sp. CENA71]|nr:PAS domain-containing sensor histidine kinase [Fischerella sp. CENA71]
MSLNQPFRRHHTCQQQHNTVSATSAWLELVPEKASEVEICTAESWRRTQEELLWYRKLYENIPCVYFILNQDGVILSVNYFGATSLGYSPQELVQQPVLNLFEQSEQQRLSDVLMTLLGEPQENATVNIELCLNCPASQMVWVKVGVRVLQSGKENPLILMVCEDITERKLAEVPLKQSQKDTQAQLEELETLNRLKDEFLNTISHELRTPLTNMKMAIQMLEIALNQEQNLLSEMSKHHLERSKVARYFQILNNECDREINLINKFLDLQRLDIGAKPLVLETIQVQEWLERVVRLFQVRDRNSYSHNLHIRIADNLPSFICDQFSLERILIELLTNACKFSPTDAEIIIAAQSKASFMQIQVTNYGVEIPASELPRIFDKFYRIPSNDPLKQGGTGLGLALVQKMTKYIGGTIKAESGSNYTCFTIQLPL